MVMEENGDQYRRKMDSFLKTVNTIVNRSTCKTRKNVIIKDFLSSFYRYPIDQYKRQRFEMGENARI